MTVREGMSSTVTDRLTYWPTVKPTSAPSTVAPTVVEVIVIVEVSKIKIESGTRAKVVEEVTRAQEKVILVVGGVRAPILL